MNPRALLLGLAALVCACGAPAPAPSPASPEGPALWRIQDQDSEIWLFGTVHVLPPDLDWRNARIDDAFNGADELVVETDTSDAAAGAALVSRYGLAPAGAQLSAALTPAAAQRLRRVATSLDINPTQLEPLRPWLAAMQVSYAYAAKQGQQREAGVEEVLLPLARARGARVSFLETPEQQIRTLADLSTRDQLRFLDISLREIEEQPDSIAALDAAWARGDVTELDRLQRTQLSAAGPEVYAALITRRNAAWTAEIQRRLAGSGKIFYAVGAAHLVGDEGVVALLRARGVRVDGP